MSDPAVPRDALRVVVDGGRYFEGPRWHGGNPYAPPVHDPTAIGPVPQAGCWRDGDAAVVLRPTADLPDRCVRCNQPVDGFRLEKKLYWHSPILYIAILVSPLVYVVIALILRKTVTVRFGLCPGHRARRRNGMLVGWLGTALAITTCSAGIASDTPEAIFGGMGLFLILPIVGIAMAHVIQPKKIEHHFAWLKVGKPFLESLEAARSP